MNPYLPPTGACDGCGSSSTSCQCERDRGDGFYTCRDCGERLLDGEQEYCAEHAKE